MTPTHKPIFVGSNIIFQVADTSYTQQSRPGTLAPPGPACSLIPSNEKVLVTQLCPTLCDPMNCSPPSSSVHGISQARILEWVAIPFSRRSSQPRDPSCVSCVSYIAGDSSPSKPPGETIPSNYLLQSLSSVLEISYITLSAPI